jgi:hypothetical protein
MKGYTDLEQSKKLTEILPLESADMYWSRCTITDFGDGILNVSYAVEPCNISQFRNTKEDVPCWSLAALVKCLSKIKPQVYTPILFPSESKWILQFAEYGHGNVCEVSCDNPIDACYEMIIKLNELKML